MSSVWNLLAWEIVKFLMQSAVCLIKYMCECRHARRQKNWCFDILLNKICSLKVLYLLILFEVLSEVLMAEKWRRRSYVNHWQILMFVLWIVLNFLRNLYCTKNEVFFWKCNQICSFLQILVTFTGVGHIYLKVH